LVNSLFLDEIKRISDYLPQLHFGQTECSGKSAVVQKMASGYPKNSSGFARRSFELNLNAGRHIRGRLTDIESKTARVPGG
jgi:hypothetical protein